MKIELRTSYIPLLVRLDNSDKPEGVSVLVPPIEMTRTVGDNPIALAVISLAASVPVGVFVNWLWDKIKDKPAKITINRREVTFSKGEIRKVVEESIHLDE